MQLCIENFLPDTPLEKILSHYKEVIGKDVSFSHCPSTFLPLFHIDDVTYNNGDTYGKSTFVSLL